jgi:hypothetical protein
VHLKVEELYDIVEEEMGRGGEDVSSYKVTLEKQQHTGTSKEEALYRTLWRTHFKKGYGPVVRQTTS